MPRDSWGRRRIVLTRPARIGIGGMVALLAGAFLVGCSTAGQNSTSSAASTASEATSPPPSLPPATPATSRPEPAPSQDSSDVGANYVNSIGMEFVPVPAGQFLLGSPAEELDASEFERPQHEVSISAPFQLHDIAARHCMVCSGDFGRVPNPMHFEIHCTPEQIAARVAARPQYVEAA